MLPTFGGPSICDWATFQAFWALILPTLGVQVVV